MSDIGPPAAAPPPPSEPTPLPWWNRRWWRLPVWAWLAIVTVLIVAIAALAASASGDETGTTGVTTTSALEPVDTAANEATTAAETTAPETTVAGSIVVETTATTTTTTQATATTTPTPTPTTTTATAATTTAAATTTTVPPPPPIVFSGSGDDVVDMGAGSTRFVLHATHDGGSNFQVDVLDAELSTIDFPVNEIGPFDGTVIMNVTGGRYLQVTADGNWSLELIDTAALPVAPDGGFTGSVDVVVRYTGAGGIYTITHDGESNFQVDLHDVTTGEVTDFVINEIGPYNGRNPLAAGPVLVAVIADGNWTFAKG